VSNAFPGALTPPATRAGPFVFAGTHTPHSPDSGALVTGQSGLGGEPARRFASLKRNNLYVDILREGIVAQTLQVISNLERSLLAAGSQLARLVHLRIFVHDLVDELFVMQTLRAILGDALPSGGLVAARNAGSDPAIRVHVDAIALADDAPWSIEHVRLADDAALTAPFPTATRAGPYIVTSNLPGTTRDGRVVAAASDLAREERDLVASLGDLPLSQRAFILQQAAMWGHARRVLAELGSALDQVVHHLAWLGVSMQALGNGSVTRLVSPPGRPKGEQDPERVSAKGMSMSPLVDAYCLTAFPVAGMRVPGSLVEGRYIALDPSQGIAKTVRMPRNALSHSYFSAIQAGPLVFAAGEVPIDLARGRLVAEGSSFEGRSGIEFGLVHADRRALVEAAYVYQCIGESLAAYGLAYEDMTQQLLYLCDARDYGTMLAVHAAVSGRARMPTTSTVPIVGASPYLDNRLEIEFFAVTPP
jgi:enamine deaminase RidA (YjgF/YER057c/UK114 family)